MKCRLVLDIYRKCSLWLIWVRKFIVLIVCFS